MSWDPRCPDDRQADARACRGDHSDALPLVPMVLSRMERRELEHDQLLEKFMALSLKERIAILRSLKAWGEVQQAVQVQADAYLEQGQPFSPDLTVALALCEYRRHTNRPSTRLQALKMIEKIQRDRSDSAAQLLRVQELELDGLRRGWVQAQKVEEMRASRRARISKERQQKLDFIKAKRGAKGQADDAAAAEDVEGILNEHLNRE